MRGAGATRELRKCDYDVVGMGFHRQCSRCVYLKGTMLVKCRIGGGKREEREI